MNKINDYNEFLQNGQIGAIGAGIESKNTPIENVLKFKEIFEKINN